MGTLREDLAFAGAGSDVIETHISWVFRSPTEVFKVKRPVTFPFLDFAPLEARRRACEAELRLNRRLAPDVYLGTVPVCRDRNGRHNVRGDGDLVDWAVHMRRLPDAQRADTMLRAGRLDANAIDRVAERLATFHHDAPCDPAVVEFGTAPAMRANVVENFETARAWIESYLTPPQRAEIERKQLGFIDEHTALFDQRIAGGCVRDGHGDLRLEHVYVGANEIVVIDCVEFDDRFRVGDVCGDIAFLAMDLAWHGRTDLAERFLARYALDANDYDSYAMVDFYATYRALVRAKIAGSIAADPSASVDVRERMRSDARRYLLLALAEGRPTVLPSSVVAVGGVIASGKSTIADAVARELGAPVIEADRTRKNMLGIEPTNAVRDDAFRGAYDKAFTEQVYSEVLRRADRVLASGRPVVIDASFRSQAQRKAARALALRHGVPFRLVECRPPNEVCRQRLRLRESTPTISDGRLEIFDAFVAQVEAVLELPSREHVVLDTSRPISDTLETLRRRLDVWPVGLVG